MKGFQLKKSLENMNVNSRAHLFNETIKNTSQNLCST